MIESGVEHDNPIVPGGSVLELYLTPKLGESVEDFNHRMDLFTHGLHQMEFHKVSEREYRLAIELNPSWDEPEEFDPSKLSKADLLAELDAVPVSRHTNKIDYGG